MKFRYENFKIDESDFYEIEVCLPKTTLLIVGNDIGYFMCGALDVDMFNAPHLVKRGVINGRAVGVKTIEELLDAKLEKVSICAKDLGIIEGMVVREALKILI